MHMVNGQVIQSLNESGECESDYSDERDRCGLFWGGEQEDINHRVKSFFCCKTHYIFSQKRAMKD